MGLDVTSPDGLSERLSFPAETENISDSSGKDVVVVLDGSQPERKSKQKRIDRKTVTFWPLIPKQLHNADLQFLKTRNYIQNKIEENAIVVRIFLIGTGPYFFCRQVVRPMVNRMAYLRHAKGKTIMEVAYDLDLPITTYQQYESGLREPPFKTLIAIANYYSCTLDYLLCRTEIFEQPSQKDMDLAFQLNRLLEPDDISALNTLISHLEKRHEK